MPNVYFIGAFALAVLLGIGGAYVKGRSDGTEITKSTYAQRDTQAATAYAAKEREITEAYRQKETEWAKSSAETGRRFQREIDKNATDYLTLLATHPQLRDAGSHCEAPSGGPAATAADPRIPDSGEFVLSERTSGFLWDQAAAADRTRVKLNSCISLLEQERAP